MSMSVRHQAENSKSSPRPVFSVYSKDGEKAVAGNPTLSVVMPCLNEELTLGVCIKKNTTDFRGKPHRRRDYRGRQRKHRPLL